jgi:predicted heme/steroid binding protein
LPVFTPQKLAEFDGRVGGCGILIAHWDIVYDVTDSIMSMAGRHFRLLASRDLDRMVRRCSPAFKS